MFFTKDWIFVEDLFGRFSIGAESWPFIGGKEGVGKNLFNVFDHCFLLLPGNNR